MRSPIARSWSQWLRDFWASCGFSPSVQQHSDLTVTGAEMDLSISGISWTAYVGNLYLPEFPAGADEGAAATIRLPNNYREGTALKPYLEWAPADAAAGDVDWRFEYLQVRNGAILAVAATNLDETSAAPGVASQPTRVEFDDIALDLRKGDSIIIRLWRLGTGDTYAAGAHLVSCGLKYVIDGVGAEAAHP